MRPPRNAGEMSQSWLKRSNQAGASMRPPRNAGEMTPTGAASRECCPRFNEAPAKRGGNVLRVGAGDSGIRQLQ